MGGVLNHAKSLAPGESHDLLGVESLFFEALSKVVLGWEVAKRVALGSRCSVLTTVEVLVKHDWTASPLNCSESSCHRVISHGELIVYHRCLGFHILELIGESNKWLVLWGSGVLVEPPSCFHSSTGSAWCPGQGVVINESDPLLPWELLRFFCEGSPELRS